MGQATRGHAARLHRQRTQEKIYRLSGIDELRERLAKLRPMNQGEPEVVPSVELAAVIADWKHKYERTHPVTISEWGPRASSEPYGPYAYISTMSGVTPRQIGRIIKGDITNVGITCADAILVAIDRVDAFHTGEINVKVSPHWQPRRWLEYMAAALEIKHKAVTVRQLKRIVERQGPEGNH